MVYTSTHKTLLAIEKPTNYLDNSAPGQYLCDKIGETDLLCSTEVMQT